MIRSRAKSEAVRQRPTKHVAKWRKVRTPSEFQRGLERMREQYMEHLVPLEELRRNLAEDLGDQSLSELFIRMKGL
jgi:hypothetical protein